jgi:haloalkane dehalogenase
MKRILLTTVFRPYGFGSKYNKVGDEEWLDYFYSRLSKEPGPFALSSYPSGTALQLMASNVRADVTVLFHPTVEEYIAELQKGYDYVGITFLIKGLGKLFPMIAMARKHAPQTEVIIGGFGTMLHNLNDAGADHVCKGEGVAFLRGLLGQDRTGPTRQPLVTADITLKVMREYDFLPRFRFAQLTHGFGCPHRCEFCSTSAYYGYRHIPFARDRSMYDAMVEVYDRTGIDAFWLFEEDMCLYKDSLKTWGTLIRDDAERTFSWAAFSTVKSLTSWDLEGLVSMGFNHVWIGVESINSPFSKNTGRDIAGLFDELEDLGVTTTGSIIYGLDHHTPENLPRELEHFIALRPTTTQIGTLMPADGTALRARLELEGRVRKASYKESDLYSEILIHPNFQKGQLRDAVFAGYDAFYEANGPAIHRAARTWLRGAMRLSHSTNPALRRRGAMLARRAKRVRPVFLETLDYLPNEGVRDQVRATLAAMEEVLGSPDDSERAQARFVERIFALEQAKRDVVPARPIEPSTNIRRWVDGVEVAPGATVASGPGPVLARVM